MKLCSENHDEVCYEERKCPMCELQGIIESLSKERAILEDEIKCWEKEA